MNTVPYPLGEEDRLTVRDLAQPAVLSYDGFPLSLRKPSRKIKKQDIAFNVFFGRPVLIVEHHEVFQSPETLLEVVANINLLVPDIRWANLTTIVSNSFLARREMIEQYMCAHTLNWSRFPTTRALRRII